MKILVVNAGSSSLKYQLMDMADESVIAKGNCERIGIDGRITHSAFNGQKYEAEINFPSHTEAFMSVVDALTKGEAAVINSMDEIGAVGHRVVQGAEVYTDTVKVTDEVIEKIDEMRELAPVHNHAHALALRACKKVMPESVPQAAVFDTAFHTTIPEKAYIYGMPYEAYEKYNVRKYGFHGTSHKYVSQKLALHLGIDITKTKIVTCHLGNGSSITAVDGGKSVDTSMGFTPLDGILMGTRSGAVDPSAVTFMMKKLNLTPSEMEDWLNKKSGLLGIGGHSDNRDISNAIKEGCPKAKLAAQILRYGIKKYIGSYAAVMNGLDYVIFTGGIGENAVDVRADVCADMDFLGITLDSGINSKTQGTLTKISTESSKTQVWVVPTNEELLIARSTKDLFNL
ncbi:MAG: acetate kinase [Oscillospiraceae bacterium]|nr:acetate kinase [Oscillospiraceae bacterium]